MCRRDNVGGTQALAPWRLGAGISLERKRGNVDRAAGATFPMDVREVANEQDRQQGPASFRQVRERGRRGARPLSAVPAAMPWPTRRRMLPDVLRLVAESRTRPYHSPRDMALWRELAAIVADVRPDHPASLSTIRLPLLRRILEAEWGAPALRDETTLAMLRTEDRLIAVDPDMSDVLRRAVMMLKRLY